MTLFLSLSLLLSLNARAVPTNDPVSGVIAAKVDIALCTNGRQGYSIEDRRRALDEAVTEIEQLLPGLSAEFTAQIRTPLRNLRLYKLKSDTDPHFWDVGTTCPRQLIYPNAEVGPSAAERLNALDRARAYRNVALCLYGRGRYSLEDRRGFLDAAITLFGLLKSDALESTAAEAARELNVLAPLQEDAHAEDLRFWDVGSTCPRR